MNARPRTPCTHRPFRQPGFRQSRAARGGLTLLEVLLASALGIVLIGGIYAAIDQSWKMTASGKIELERQQIARAVMRRIELDLRAAMFSSAPSSSADETEGLIAAISAVSSATGATTGTTTSTSTSNSTSTSTSSTTEEDPWQTSLGIRGTATELTIDLSHARHTSSLIQSLNPLATDLQTVEYGMGAISSSLAEDGAPGGRLVRLDADGMGLVRSQGERTSIRDSSEKTSASAVGALPGTPQMLAPEIQTIQFRYFSGVAWQTEWDSVTMEGLPRAVEIVIVFEPPPVMGLMARAPVSARTDYYRMVVAIPTSSPVLTEEQQ